MDVNAQGLRTEMVTPLATQVGYDKAAELAYRAYQEGKTVCVVVEASGLLSPQEIERARDPRSMVGDR